MLLALTNSHRNNVLRKGDSVAWEMRWVLACLLRWAVRALSPSDPSLLSSRASGPSVGGYDDTSSDHSPANAADPPATSANSPATPSPAPAAAGTHASTGNCFLNSCPRWPLEVPEGFASQNVPGERSCPHPGSEPLSSRALR